MTNNEIINILEHCIKSECHKCERTWNDEHLRPCMQHLMFESLDLINRQQAEIERLNTQRDKVIKEFTEFAHTAPYNPFACMYCVHSIDNGRACEWKREHEDEEISCFGKQFVYRDNLVKEMVGEE